MKKKPLKYITHPLVPVCPTDDAAERTAAMTKREETAEGSQISCALEDESEP